MRTAAAVTSAGNQYPGPTTAKRLLADISALAPDITSRAEEIEAGRRIPLDLVDMLRSIGVFRMLVPQSHGGLELDLPSALEVIGALGRIDGSVGWTAGIGSGADLVAPLLPRETYDQVYEDSPDVIIAAPPTRRATGRSRTPGTSRGSKGPGATTSPSRTRWSRRRISSTSRAACRACPDRCTKPCRTSSR